MASTLDIHDNAPNDKNQELELIVDSEGDIDDETAQFHEEEDIYFENDQNENCCMDKPALYSVKLLENWCKQNGEKVDLKTDSPQSINRILSSFYPDVRNKTGEPYSHSTLALFRYGLNRYFQNDLVRGGSKIDIIEDPEFQQANNIFKHVIKVMKEHNPVHEAQIITPEHIRRIYASYAFSLLDAKCLLYKVWFEITVFFGKPKHDQQRSLRKDDFVIGMDENGSRFVTKKGPVEGESQAFPRMYEKKGDSQCPVLSFEKYLSKLDKGYIYLFQRPRDKTPVNPQQSWYMPMSPGKNFMFRMMSRISKLANLDTIFTNSVLKKLHRGLLIDMFLHRHDMIQLSAAKGIGPTHTQPDLESNNLFDNSDRQNSSDSKEVDSSAVLGSYRPILPADAKESMTSSKSVSGSLHRKLQLVRMYPQKQNEESILDAMGSKVSIATSNTSDSIESVQLQGVKSHQDPADTCHEKEPLTKFGVEEAKVKVKMIFQELDYPDLVQLDCWLKKVEVLKDTSGKVICRDPSPAVNNLVQRGDVMPKNNPSSKANPLQKGDVTQIDLIPKHNVTQKGDTPKADLKQKDEQMSKGETQRSDQMPKRDVAKKSDLMPKSELGKFNMVPKKVVSKKSKLMTKPEATQKCDPAQKADVSPKGTMKRRGDQMSKDKVTKSNDVMTKDDQNSTKTYGKKRQELVVLYPNIISRNRKRPAHKIHTTTLTPKPTNAKLTSSAAFAPPAELPMNPAPVIGTIVPATALPNSTAHCQKPSELPKRTARNRPSADIQVKVEPGFPTTVATTTSTTLSFAATLVTTSSTTQSFTATPATTTPTKLLSSSNDAVTVASNVEMVLPQSSPSIWHIPQIQSHQVADIKPERDILSLSVLNPSTLIMHSIPRIPLNISDSTLAQRLVQFPHQGSYYLRNNSDVDTTGSIGSVVSDAEKVPPADAVSVGSSVVPVVSPTGLYIPEPQQLNESLANARGTSMTNTSSEKLASAEDKEATDVPKLSEESPGIKKRSLYGKNDSGTSKRRKLKIINMIAKKCT